MGKSTEEVIGGHVDPRLPRHLGRGLLLSDILRYSIHYDMYMLMIFHGLGDNRSHLQAEIG